MNLSMNVNFAGKKEIDTIEHTPRGKFEGAVFPPGKKEIDTIEHTPRGKFEGAVFKAPEERSTGSLNLLA